MMPLFRMLKLLVKAALGRDILVKPGLACETRRFGSEYGGWIVATEKIDQHSVVYSFGVGEDVSFDVALIEKYGVTVHAFDPTPKSIDWVRKQVLPKAFQLHPFGIAAFDGSVSFSPPENPDHVSHTLLDRVSTKHQAITAPVKRLSTIMSELGHDHIDILKMDVEGAEYDVIEDIARSGIRPHQILVEFHHRFPEVGVEKTKSALETLRSMGYELFAVSESNEEYSFVRNPT